HRANWSLRLRHSDGERLPAHGIGVGLARGEARGAQASILSPPLYRRTRAGALQSLSPPVRAGERGGREGKSVRRVSRPAAEARPRVAVGGVASGPEAVG